MTTRLDEILARTRLDVAKRRAAVSLPVLERRAACHRPRGFASGLRRVAAEGRPAVIAELKKASPSKGVIREDFKVAELAAALEGAGAAALSVLTDMPFFQGSLDDLALASGATTIPCLRKDFMVDAFQVLEARAFGADAILLIVAGLSDAELKTLSGAAAALELDVLCEVHDVEELKRAADVECAMIGVNSRDLRSFAVRPEVQVELVEQIPDGVVRVAESGLTRRAEIDRLRAAGYEAFLIGEALMRAADPAAALSELIGQPRAAAV